MITLTAMRALPRPTAAQQAAFVQHLLCRHDWYKHLSLLHGARFIVFAAPDAGGDEARLRERNDLHWRTPAQYRLLYGSLDFMHHVGGDVWAREFGEPGLPGLPAEIVQRCAFTLFPYCSPFEFEALAGGWGLRVDEGETEAALPAEVRHTIRALRQINDQLGHAMQTLSPAEREAHIDARRWGEPEEPLPEAVRESLAWERRQQEVYDALHAPEVGKVWHALTQLEALVWPDEED